jgi:hypothetical protein
LLRTEVIPIFNKYFSSYPSMRLFTIPNLDFFSFFGVQRDSVHLVHRPLLALLYQHWMMDEDECGAVGGMIVRRNRSTRRKPASVPLCPPQIPHDLIRRDGKPATNYNYNTVCSGPNGKSVRDPHLDFCVQAEDSTQLSSLSSPQGHTGWRQTSVKHHGYC